MRDETPEQAAARRAIDAQRKRDERARDKEQKQLAAAAQKASEATSFPEYWETQRKSLTPELRSQYEQREEEVLDIEHYMRFFLDGREDAFGLPEDERVSLPELVEIVKEDVKAHGTCMEMVLVVEGLWSDNERQLRERILGKNDATATLLTYGYVTAITQRLLHKFQQLSVTSRPNYGSGYVRMQCESCTDPLAVETVHESIAADYKTLRVPFLCGKCRALETKSREISRAAIGKETLHQSPESHALFDSWGRLRDQ
jgi:hypothetical protein